MIQVLPQVKVVKIGGQSLIDRGAEALLPVLDEIATCKEEHGLDVVLCAGGGTRARSIYSLGVELELSPGMLSALGGKVATQNALILAAYLAARGGIYITPADFLRVPNYLRSGCIPVTGGMPPYGFWEMPDSDGSRVPPHRTDSGTFLSAEFFGAGRAIYVKDEDGLFTDDPKRNPAAQHIPEITAAELSALDIADVVIERVLLDYLPKALWCKQIQIVNGLKPGEVTRALLGERNGSLITA